MIIHPHNVEKTRLSRELYHVDSLESSMIGMKTAEADKVF